MTLARSGGGAQRLYSMSAAIERSRIGYYEALQSITSNEALDITSWIEWLLDRLGDAVGGALATLDNVMLKNDFWQKHAAHDLNPRQAKVLNRLLEGNFEGKLTSTKWAKLTNASQDTASRDIADLLVKGILRNGDAGGRSTAYELIMDFPENPTPRSAGG
jgi:Fic family protein